MIRVSAVLWLLIVVSGCAVSPKSVVQMHDGLHVTLNKDSSNQFRLIDKRRNVIAKAVSLDRNLVFSIPQYTSPNACLTVVDQKGNHLFDQTAGYKITTVYEYQNALRQKKQYQSQKNLAMNKTNRLSSSYTSAKKSMNAHRLFNGNTCDLPPQKPTPPKPKVLCGSNNQCKNLASDSCLKNLAAAETCAVALSESPFHSAISSVACGAVLASANKEKYGIESGALDALTGVFDENTRKQWNNDNIEGAIISGGISLGIRYFRVRACKSDFLNAAYAPLRRWESNREHAQNKRYREQNSCANRIELHNSSLSVRNENINLIKKLDKDIDLLSSTIQKQMKTSSVPIKCTM